MSDTPTRRRASARYLEKLRDPRWQKKRLEILSRDEWTCQCCFDTTSTLHVHHRRYLPKREPWEYPDGHLVTLCESCHQNETDGMREALFLLEESAALFFLSHDVDTLACALHESPRRDAPHFMAVVDYFLKNEDLFDAAAESYLSAMRYVDEFAERQKEMTKEDAS